MKLKAIRELFDEGLNHEDKATRRKNMTDTFNKQNPNVGDLRVWWIPQIPMKPFEADVSSVEEGVRLMDVLAKYDKFQYDNRIKPDYSNVGGLWEWVSDDGDGKPGWTDWYDEETGDEDPAEWLKAQKVESVEVV
jgi:hypothetical protein